MVEKLAATTSRHDPQIKFLWKSLFWMVQAILRYFSRPLSSETLHVWLEVWFVYIGTTRYLLLISTHKKVSLQPVFCVETSFSL